MNDGEVEKQIDQMVRFIKQEAEEKANEINVSAEEVCTDGSTLLFPPFKSPFSLPLAFSIIFF